MRKTRCTVATGRWSMRVGSVTDVTTPPHHFTYSRQQPGAEYKYWAHESQRLRGRDQVVDFKGNVAEISCWARAATIPCTSATRLLVGSVPTANEEVPDRFDRKRVEETTRETSCRPRTSWQRNARVGRRRKKLVSIRIQSRDSSSTETRARRARWGSHTTVVWRTI